MWQTSKEGVHVKASEPERFARAVRLHPDDTVAVLIEEAAPGMGVSFVGEARKAAIVVQESIPYGHKVALRSMQGGSAVLKYGEPMGIATQEIRPGEHVHVHNVRGLESKERGGGGVGHVSGL